MNAKETVVIASALMNILSGGGYVSPTVWDQVVGPVLNAIAHPRSPNAHKLELHF